VRDYTSNNIAPLLETQIKYEFRPEMVSAFSAIEVLKNLRAAQPRVQAVPVSRGDAQPDQPGRQGGRLGERRHQRFPQRLAPAPLLGERDTPNGRMLFLAKPLKAGAACLRCHDTAEVAPPTMIAKYGSAGGFGWKAGEIIGAQIVQVPAESAQARAEATFRIFMASVVAVLLAIALTLNGLLWWMFIRPVTRISALADQISLGAFDAADFVARSRDEIGALAQALSRMRRSLVQAMKMLDAV
jgi:protein-histidine pros-kinase